MLSPIPYETHLDTLFAAHLLCEVCQEHPWTQQAQWHTALICDGCAEGEPEPDEEMP